MARRAKATPASTQSAARLVHSALDTQAATLRGHLEVLRASCTPESVHGVRVACRRLRAALWLMRPVAPQARAAGKALRELARGLAHLRETDVFIARLRDADAPELAEVESRLVAKRKELAAAALAGAAGDAALQALAQRGTPDLTELDRMLPARLARLRSRFRRAFKLAVVRLTAEHVHALRLRTKKLRYAIECAGGVVRKHQAAVSALRKLQEQLGDCLDARLAANEMKAQGRASPEARKLARQLRAEVRRLLRALPDLLQHFEADAWPILKAAVPKPKGPKTRNSTWFDTLSPMTATPSNGPMTASAH